MRKCLVVLCGNVWWYCEEMFGGIVAEVLSPYEINALTQQKDLLVHLCMKVIFD